MSDPIGSLRNPVEPDQNPERPQPLPWQEYSDRVQSEWFALLASDPEEAEVQQFMELHPALIPGGSGDVGPGGHHQSELNLVFRQPKLKGAGRDFAPDFMWVTHSSSLITPILIEIEKPSKRWFTQEGRPTAHFTQAQDQLRDWRGWFALDGNERIFRDQYLFLGDRWADRTLEPQYVLIYGRQSEFTLGGGHSDFEALNRKRGHLHGAGETFLTFDSLRPRFDHSSSITATMTATGPTAFAFSPVYSTGAHLLGDLRHLGGVEEALDRSVMMTDERRTYLNDRWRHWLTMTDRQETSGRHWTQQMGRE